MLRLEAPLWYLIALPVFHLLWWATRRMPTRIPLLVTGISYVLVDMKLIPLKGTLTSTGFSRDASLRVLLHRVCSPESRPATCRGAYDAMGVSRCRACWLALEQWLPTLPLKPLVSLPTGPETNA